MKVLKIISAILILTGLYACEPAATFTEPQPTDTKNLSKFGKRLQGTYRSLRDSSILTISDEIIQRIYDFKHRIHINELDSSVQLIGDTLVNLTTNNKMPVKQDRDSLIVHIHHIDTLFQRNDKHIIKKYNGYYFLNIQYNKVSWTVKKLQLSKEQLVISDISAKEDIDNLNEITGQSDTTVIQDYTITKKQFKGFVKDGGFSDDETFIRLKDKE